MNAAFANLPTPDFSYDPKTDLRAGVRPYRRGSFCLEAVTIGSKAVVHNYGHGGAGITMALGCALEVVDLLRASGRATAGTPVAVLGGGVMGLTAATLLRSEMQLSVTMYAEAFSNTTSDRAGGQWCPSLVEPGRTPPEKQRFDRILRRSFRGYEAMIGNGFGVYRRPNYTWVRTKYFRMVPVDLIPAPRHLQRLPFDGHGTDGYEYQTLLVEPPDFLGRLRRDLDAAGVPRVTQVFTSPQQVQDLSEQLVVNCTGLGSDRIWTDGQLVPIKGQLILLRPQPALQYLYSGAPQGYVFPRSDKVVVGGTQEEGVADDQPDEAMCAAIIQAHKDAFAARMSMVRALPDWFIKFK